MASARAWGTAWAASWPACSTRTRPSAAARSPRSTTSATSSSSGALAAPFVVGRCKSPFPNTHTHTVHPSPTMPAVSLQSQSITQAEAESLISFWVQACSPVSMHPAALLMSATVVVLPGQPFPGLTSHAPACEQHCLHCCCDTAFCGYAGITGTSLRRRSQARQQRRMRPGWGRACRSWDPGSR